MTTTRAMVTQESTPKERRDRPYRTRGSADIMKPSLGGLIGKYALLIGVLAIMVFPFLWQMSTSFKGAAENIYDFPPSLIPNAPTLDNYAEVFRTIPVLDYAWHSLLVGVGTVLTNVVFATIGGYALGTMKFRGKWIVLAIFFSTLLLPGEVTLTSQYLTVKSLGLANTLWGVFLPGAIAAINVLLMMAACRMIPRTPWMRRPSTAPTRCSVCATSCGRTSAAWSRSSRCSPSSAPGTTSSGLWSCCPIPRTTR